MNVFFSAGEASGDAYAAALTTEMRRLNQGRQDLTFTGIGGKRFRGAGASIVADSSGWGAVSILESLKVVPKVMGGYYRAKRFIRRSQPGLLIPIDFGYVNIRLSRHAKNMGWKVLYFVPPSSWRRDKQGRDLPQITDAVATPFSWSADLLNAAGANAYWYGHPIRQLLRDRGVGRAPSESERIAVLPGSRSHEIEQNLPLLAAVVREPVEFALAPSVDAARFRAEWQRLAPGRSGDLFTSGDVYGVLARCCASVVCSGTATLEAALCRCPMVVIYKFPKIAEIEAKIVRFKLPEFVSLPNLLLQKRAVPELIQWDATPENLRRELDLVLKSPEARQGQLADFDDLEQLLGPDDAISRSAELALSLLKTTS
jgi:lipid-A-disaccharide synthase